ncbi:MAG TPA: fibronectin type III domain-containing protein [Candidatus Deferrimicrobiaceae bacterium]
MNSHGIRSADNGFRAAHRFRELLAFMLFVLLPGSVFGGADLSPGPGTNGVRVSREVPFASETFDAVRAAPPGRATQPRVGRAIPFRRIYRDPSTGVYGAPADAPSAPAIRFSVAASGPIAPSAPVLDASFAGLGNPPHGRDRIPPDTMGAAGPNHLVSILNSEFGVFDKSTGAILDNVSLESFWSALGADPGEPADFPFDPKVLYDQHSGRFVAVSIGGRSAPGSWILVAVSSSNDPLQAWNKWAIDADRDNDAQLFFNGADFPGLGIDGANLYITANMFDNNDIYRYSKIWVIPKNQLLAGSNPITWTEFRDPPGSGPTMQPAHTFGTPAAEYFLYEDQFINATSLLLAKIDNVAGTPVWHSPTTVAVAPYVEGLLPGAPQAGDTRTIDTADTRLLNAVYRNGTVWTTHTVAVGGKTEVAWYRVDPATSPAAAQGRIRDTSRWYYYPSVAVNTNDVAAIGFSGSSTVEYAGGYYTVIRPPFVSAEPASLLKSGVAPYYKTLSGTDNRWGDFSATVVDPVDDVTFWTLQEYAEAPVPDPITSALVSQWGTWWGKFHPSDVSAPTGLTATASAGPRVVLTWTDASVNEAGFRVERRSLPGEDYAIIASVAPNVITFTDNTSTGLLGGFTYSYRVQAHDATGGSYSGEAFASTAPPAPPPSSGGGGGCLAIAPSAGPTVDASSVLSLLILLLPAAVYGWNKWSRPGNA